MNDENVIKPNIKTLLIKEQDKVREIVNPNRTFDEFIQDLQKGFPDLSRADIKEQLRINFGVVDSLKEAKKHKCWHWDEYKKHIKKRG